MLHDYYNNCKQRSKYQQHRLNHCVKFPNLLIPMQLAMQSEVTLFDGALIDSQTRDKVMELITRLATEYKNCQRFIETSPMTHDGTLTVPEFASSSASGSKRNLKLEEKSRCMTREEKSEDIASPMKKQKLVSDVDDDVDTTISNNETDIIWQSYLSNSHVSGDPFGVSLARSSPIQSELDQKVQHYWTLVKSRNPVAVYKALRKSRKNKILDAFTQISLSLEDFRRLKCIDDSNKLDLSKWLNDQVIDFICLMLKIRECTKRRISNGKYQPKYIGAALVTTAIKDNHLKEDQMMNLCKYYRIRPFSFDTLIMPFNITNNHWVFFVIKPKLKLVVGYNSMDSCFEDQIMPHILYWLEIESKYLQVELCVSDWQFKMHPNCPRQTNSMDCGVMMLTGILYTCDDMNLSYSQSTMNKERKRFAADILDAKITDTLPPPTKEDMIEAVELEKKPEEQNSGL